MNYPVRNFKERFNTTRGNPYGLKVTPTYYHSGNDINTNTGGNTDCGTPVLSVADGEVSSVHAHATGYGQHIHIKHTINGRTYWSHYAHLETMTVQLGQVVKQGDMIGTLGSTGNSDYCHLHFEIKNTPTGIDGIAKSKEDLKKWENPIEFIEANLGNVIISPPVSNIDYKAIFDKTGDLLPDRALKDDTFLDTSKLYKDNNIPYVTLAADSVNHYMSEYRKFRDIANTPTTTPPDAPQSGDNFEAVVDPPLPVEPDLPTYPATEFDIFDWLWRKISNLWKR